MKKDVIIIKTTVVNKYQASYDVYIGRGSKWGNPYSMKNKSDKERNKVCDLYEEYFWVTNLCYDVKELRGKTLGCFCKPKRCHGDFLADLANMDQEELDELIYSKKKEGE